MKSGWCSPFFWVQLNYFPCSISRRTWERPCFGGLLLCSDVNVIRIFSHRARVEIFQKRVKKLKLNNIAFFEENCEIKMFVGA